MATKSVPLLPASDAGDNGHIPTLPFGTKRVVGSPPRVVGSPPPVREQSRFDQFAPFRFLITEDQITAALRSSGPHFGPTVAPARRVEQPRRSGWLILLSAVVLTTLVFTLVAWSVISNYPEKAAAGGDPAAARRSQTASERAALGTNGKPGAPSAEPRSAPPAPAISASGAPQVTVAQRVPSLTTPPHPQSLRGRLSPQRAQRSSGEAYSRPCSRLHPLTERA